MAFVIFVHNRFNQNAGKRPLIHRLVTDRKYLAKSKKISLIHIKLNTNYSHEYHENSKLEKIYVYFENDSIED